MKEPFIFLSPEITRENALVLVRWLQDEEVIRYLSDGRDVSSQIQHVVDRVHLPVLTHLFSRNGRFYMACSPRNIPVGFIRLAVNGSDIEMVAVIGDRINWGKGLGTAILGCSEGDGIRWDAPSGILDIEIKKLLYQPEAAGDYHL